MEDFTKEELEKLQEKNSFLIQKSLYVDIKEMGIEEKNLFLVSVFEYVICGAIPNLIELKYRFVRASFNRFKDAYTSDSKKWLKTCKNKSEAKSKEWQERKKTPTKDQDGNPTEHPIYK